MRSFVHSVSKAIWPLRLRGFAIGMKYWLVRRPSTTVFVIPSSSNLKCRAGSSKGELMTGFSMTVAGKGGA
jgi:hypothetical protein